MTITVDPDFLDQDREVYINVSLRSFGIVIDTDASPAQSPISRIDSDGVSGQAVYSFFKEEWKSDATKIPHPFPMIAITPEQFEFIADWVPENNKSRLRIKNAGWREIDELDNLKREYAGIITLGTFAESTDQAYYQQGTDSADIAAATNFDRTDAVNEPILTYDEIVPVDTSSPGHTFGSDTITRNDGGSFTTDGFQIGARVVVIGDTSSSPSKDGTYVLTDVTATVLTVSGSPFTTLEGSSEDARLAKEFRNALTIFLREGFDGGFGTGKTFAQSDLSDIGVTTLTYQAYRFPVTNAADLKVTNDDGTIEARSPEVAIVYYDTPQLFTGFIADAGSTSSPNTEALFGIVIDANGYTAEEVYEFIQHELRQAADINDAGSPPGVVAGNIADELLAFVGDSLQTLPAFNPLGGGTGVYIINFDSNDTNRLSFADNEFGTTARRTFPFVAAGTINFNANLVNDSMGTFWMFYEYTERFTEAFTLSASAGFTATLASTTVNLEEELSVSDFINLQGFVDPNNNGIWQVDSFGAVSPNTADISKINEDAVSDETGPGSGTLDKNPINSADAIIVEDNSTADITGAISGSSIAFDYDYDGNVQGGKDLSVDANIILRAIGLETAQFVEVTGVIIRAVGQSFTLTAGLERNYSNP